MLAAKLIFRNGLWTSPKVGTEIAMRCSVFSLVDVVRKRLKGLEGSQSQTRLLANSPTVAASRRTRIYSGREPQAI